MHVYSKASPNDIHGTHSQGHAYSIAAFGSNDTLLFDVCCPIFFILSFFKRWEEPLKCSKTTAKFTTLLPAAIHSQIMPSNKLFAVF